MENMSEFSLDNHCDEFRNELETPKLLEVNAYSAFTNGIHFYRTSNGVWYTERIPHYFLRIIDITDPNDIKKYGTINRLATKC